MVPRQRLVRLIGRGEETYAGSTAGYWLVPEQGLVVQYQAGQRSWRVSWSIWLDSQRMAVGDQLRDTRGPWLERHGFRCAQFPTRRAAAQAIAYALARDPLPALVPGDD